MNTSRSVARTIIEIAAQKKLPVTNLTLQKLLYFSHGLMLVRHDATLIQDDFQAWKYGPVVDSLYHDLKIFGSSPILPNAGFIGIWPELSDAKTRTVLNDVLNQLGNMSGRELINFSHDPESPWYAVYESDSTSIKIPNEKIKDYFKTIVRQERFA